MNVILLASSYVGMKTRTAVNAAHEAFKKQEPDWDIEVLDLAEKELVFSDGRNYLEYTGDTGEVCQKIMAADAILIGTPIFQASIPGTLKNVFDLLPQNALRDKIVGMLVTAGSSKHFLITEQQLKPILAYMKAVIVQTYVFIEDRDFEAGRLTSGDVLNRIDDLVSDIILLTNTYKKQKEIENEAFDF